MLLALDLGTTNVKALVTDRAGRPLAQGSRPVSLFHPDSGGVEQDIEAIWVSTLEAIQEALRSIPAAPIQAVGVSSQGGAMQLLDAQGRPLGRVISWLDQRGQPFDEALTAKLGRAWFVPRIAHAGSWLAIGQLQRLRQEQPHCLDQPNRVGFVGDIIVSRLCGRPAHDGTSAGLTLLYNPQARNYDPEMLQELGLAPQQLPILLSPRARAGGLLPEVARQTGLPADIPVSPAIHDQYASALGTGAVRAGQIMIGTGTAWVLLAVGERLLPPVHNDALVCHHVIEGLCGQILSMVNGGSALTWALELTGLAGQEAAAVDGLLQAAPPGSEGLRCWPFMTSFGASGLAPGTTGRLTGLQLSHRAPHVLRAVVEGLAFELNRHLDFLRQASHPASRLVLGGGAAKSLVTPQILADVTGLGLDVCTGTEASLRGAAVLARGLLEPEATLADLAQAMMPPARSIEPGPDMPFYQVQYRHYLSALPRRETEPS
jgi:xylulokinase